MAEFLHAARMKNRTPLTCLAASVILLTVAAFQWTVVDWITPFLMLPVQGAAWLFFAVALFLALVAAVRNRRSPSRAIAPVAISVVALTLMVTVPFTRIWLFGNFHLKKLARETVVSQVASGALNPNVPHNASLIALPPDPNLSAGGNEIVSQPSPNGPFVFFFTFRGILGSASGFLWVPPGATPSQFHLFNEKLGEVIAYAPNWYFISSAR